MSFSLLADWVGGSIFEIDPAALSGCGIRLLLADLDNTLAPYGVPEPDERVRDWEAKLKRHGVTLFILSNNPPPPAVRPVFQGFGGPFYRPRGEAQAPLFCAGDGADGLYSGADRYSRRPDLYRYFRREQRGRDHPAGGAIRLAGNPGRYLRYAVEWPFRVLAKRRRRAL